MNNLAHETCQYVSWSMDTGETAEHKTWYWNKLSDVRLPKEFCPDDIYFLFLTPLPSAAQSSLPWSWLQNQIATTDFQTGTLRSLSNGPCIHQQWSILKLRSLSNGPHSHWQWSVTFRHPGRSWGGQRGWGLPPWPGSPDHASSETAVPPASAQSAHCPGDT